MGHRSQRGGTDDRSVPPPTTGGRPGSALRAAFYLAAEHDGHDGHCAPVVLPYYVVQ